MSLRLLLPLIPAVVTCLNSCASPSGVQLETSSNAASARIESPAVTETSGIAASLRTDELFWVINDSGHPAEIHAVNGDGSSAATFTIERVKNTDWEDLASFIRDQKRYLAVADVGDNNAVRKTCTIVIVEEPDTASKTRTIPVAWTINFRYEDGPRDCEAIVIDGDHVLLVSKRTSPPSLYQLPLTATPDGTVATAKRVGDLDTLPTLTGGKKRTGISAYVTQPTAMDLSPDGLTLAILTYQHVYLIKRTPDESWTTASTRDPQWVKLPHPVTLRLKQREAICFTPDGKSLVITSEGKNPELYRVEL